MVVDQVDLLAYLSALLMRQLHHDQLKTWERQLEAINILRHTPFCAIHFRKKNNDERVVVLVFTCWVGIDDRSMQQQLFHLSLECSLSLK
jgi:hypothetical protein